MSSGEAVVYRWSRASLRGLIYMFHNLKKEKNILFSWDKVAFKNLDLRSNSYSLCDLFELSWGHKSITLLNKAPQNGLLRATDFLKESNQIYIFKKNYVLLSVLDFTDSKWRKTKTNPFCQFSSELSLQHFETAQGFWPCPLTVLIRYYCRPA